ncbi:hypothetical protein BDK51DRAFT_30754 [Blyttiomyces helicus]|uniref:Uncharacterized protein n=1 Tax=Blyttiomyces helicus TaxID=388810 RepID=A0A4P9WGP5_9FUNG|nr:hypothetical protein BDK51DRAFT_30754 [Blyttiomyces helicus]|eukprot:RKO91095.1 hypothetical protein BDK51DRAFT_30754 [Blyttiomyces helicus]
MPLVITFNDPLHQLFPARTYQFDRDTALIRVSLRTHSALTPFNLWLEPAAVSDFILALTTTSAPSNAEVHISVNSASAGESIPFLEAQFCYKESDNLWFYRNWWDDPEKNLRDIYAGDYAKFDQAVDRFVAEASLHSEIQPALGKTLKQFIPIALAVVDRSNEAE